MITIKVPCFPTRTKKDGKIIVKMNHCVPSWNELLGMDHFARMRRKEQIQAVFLSALQASERDSSTRTISRKSTLLTAAVTLASYLLTTRQKRASKSASASPRKARKSTR